ncbi:hypothetical protein [Paenibacillus lactis]|uniref:hypothetical protein n=1 Tax=Paenibacillus lactis TaxID=228574 RepID=UPI001B2CA960|nr:hypothetical protein [Paenibacillus lactis]GIO93538.1 hypothetical protein J31TS3_47650 [Paenibacillus lactis]
MKYSEIVKAEKLATGNPMKIAKAALMKREYDESVAAFFNDESGVSFVPVPTAEDVERFNAKAAETGDADDHARAALIADRFAHYEGEKVAHLVNRATGEQLRTKLHSAEKMTDADVRAAQEYGKLNPTADNISLYSQIKRKYEEGLA